MIHQQKYVKELIKRFGMESAKPINTPISPSTRLVMDDGSPSTTTPPSGIPLTRGAPHLRRNPIGA